MWVGLCLILSLYSKSKGRGGVEGARGSEEFNHRESSGKEEKRELSKFVVLLCLHSHQQQGHKVAHGCSQLTIIGPSNESHGWGEHITR